MNNKYLIKIAETDRISDKLRDPDYVRLATRGSFYGAVGSGLGNIAAKAVGATRPGYAKALLVGAGTGLGISSGAKASYKNQLKDQQLHDIKIHGANQRAEIHDLKVNALQKRAEQKDPNQLKKDAINLGVIAGLGTAGNVVLDKVMPKAVSAFPKVKRGLLIGGLGAATALATDYAGIKANNAINKRIDKK